MKGMSTCSIKSIESGGYYQLTLNQKLRKKQSTSRPSERFSSKNNFNKSQNQANFWSSQHDSAEIF